MSDVAHHGIGFKVFVPQRLGSVGLSSVDLVNLLPQAGVEVGIIGAASPMLFCFHISVEGMRVRFNWGGEF